MAFVVDDILLSKLILTFGPAALKGIGGFFEGITKQENFNRSLALTEKQVDAQITQFAEQNKISRQSLKQSWEKFIQTLNFQKKDAATNRVMQFIAPDIEQARRESNILKSFSRFTRGGTTPSGTNVLATATTSPQSALR